MRHISLGRCTVLFQTPLNGRAFKNPTPEERAQAPAPPADLPFIQQSEHILRFSEQGLDYLLTQPAVCSELKDRCCLCRLNVTSRCIKTHLRRSHPAPWAAHSAVALSDCAAVRPYLGAACCFCGSTPLSGTKHSSRCPVAFQVFFALRLWRHERSGGDAVLPAHNAFPAGGRGFLTSVQKQPPSP